MRSIVWFRHNLRLSDNHPLYEAAKEGEVLPVYIDHPGLSLFPDPARRRWRTLSLAALDRWLEPFGNRLHLFAGASDEILQDLARRVRADTIVAYRGLVPEDRAREEGLATRLAGSGVRLRLWGFDCLYPPDQASEGRPGPWKIFSPYERSCRSRFFPERPLPVPERICPIPVSLNGGEAGQSPRSQPLPEGGRGLAQNGFDPGEAGAARRFQDFLATHIQGYASRRDFPGEISTSRLSAHLAAGEISVREVVAGVSGSPASGADREKFLSEISWREFSSYLLFHHPGMLTEPLRKEYASLAPEREGEAFLAWTRGKTGIPFVDAGMRELAETGWMHNRARMVAASFLVKNLGISWVAGERWFAEKLLDYDPANNAASWQWVAGCGTDAAPFFRIMNPVLQGRRYDPQGLYVRQYIPELALLPDARIHAPWMRVSSQTSSSPDTPDYPEPLVDLFVSRKAALQRYRSLRHFSPDFR